MVDGCTRAPSLRSEFAIDLMERAYKFRNLPHLPFCRLASQLGIPQRRSLDSFFMGFQRYLYAPLEISMG